MEEVEQKHDPLTGTDTPEIRVTEAVPQLESAPSTDPLSHEPKTRVANVPAETTSLGTHAPPGTAGAARDADGHDSTGRSGSSLGHGGAVEPDSHESTTGRSIGSLERSAAEEEILSTIEHVEDWAEEEESEEEEELEEEDEEEEEEEEKSVDGDRDRRNPQFIPRNGAYFLHDDRLQSDDDDDDETEEEATDLAKKVLKETISESGEPSQQINPEGGGGDAPDPKVKPKKTTTKKTAATQNDVKKSKKDRTADQPAEVERWGHDLYDETTQISKTHDEIKDRYGYNIRDDDQAPRGKRNRRYARPVDPHVGTGRGRGFRGSGRGRRGYPAPRGYTTPGVPAGPSTSQAAHSGEQEGRIEPEIVEKENVHTQPEGGKIERAAGRSRPPRGTRGATRPPEAQNTARRPLQAGYEDENWQPSRSRRYEDVPPPPRTRGAAPRPPRPAYEYGTSQRAYQPPARRPTHYDDEYDDSYSSGHGEFQSRVFFSSRSRAPPSAPRRGQTGPPSGRAPAPRAFLDTARPQPKLPLQPPSRGPEKPPSSPGGHAPSAPLSKRYSERRGQNIRTEGPSTLQSDDVRALGMPRGSVPYQPGPSYRMPYVAPSPLYQQPGGMAYGPPVGPQVPLQQQYGEYYAPAGYYSSSHGPGGYYPSQGGYSGGGGYYQ